MKIGILALQGNFKQHADVLNKIGVEPVLIKYPHQLDSIIGLILPGGESTTFTLLIDRTDFRTPLLEFSKDHPLLGTCAGLIMMAKETEDIRIRPLNLLDVHVKRNGYGRQVFSFNDKIETINASSVNATFIRAPKITKIGHNATSIAFYRSEPVGVITGRHMGLSFHPEMDGITQFHEKAFMNNVSN